MCSSGGTSFQLVSFHLRNSNETGHLCPSANALISSPRCFVETLLKGLGAYTSRRTGGIDRDMANCCRCWIAPALGFAAASDLGLTGSDSLALRYAGRPLSYPRAAIASFTSLSIGQNPGFCSAEQRRCALPLLFSLGLECRRSLQRSSWFCGVTVGIGLSALCGHRPASSIRRMPQVS